jgi:hypothetical protein
MLFVANFLLSAGKLITPKRPAPEPMAKLEEAIARKQAQRYGGTMALGDLALSTQSQSASDDR